MTIRELAKHPPPLEVLFMCKGKRERCGRVVDGLVGNKEVEDRIRLGLAGSTENMTEWQTVCQLTL